MIKNLKTTWIIILNVIIIFVLLELVLAGIYNYKIKSEFNDYITLKVEGNVHPEMSPEQVKTLYYEYLDLEMEWTPYLHYSPKAFHGIYNTINNFSQRKTIKHIASDTAETIKVFCFGGSTMYGIGSTDQKTIPSLLSSILKQNYPNLNFDITNFGVLGYNRDQEAIQLQTELLNNNIPHIAVFFDGVNEAFAAYQNDGARRPTNTVHRALEFNTQKSYQKRISLFLKSSYTKKLIHYLRTKLNTKTKKPKEIASIAQKVAENYRNHVVYHHAISKKFNINTINILQPTVFTKNTLSPFEQRMKKNEIYLKEIYHQTYQTIQHDSLLLNDSSYFDLTALFNSTPETVYTDFCHTTAKGNEIIAQEMYRHIKAYLLNTKAITSTKTE